jgi:hypothetical protein
MDEQQEAIVLFFRRYNKMIFSAAFVLLLSVIGMQWYTTTHTKEKQLASENYQALKTSHSAWVASLKDTDTASREKLKERVRGLRSILAVSGQPYQDVSKLYETLEMSESGRLKEVAALNFELPSNSGVEHMDKRLLPELRALVVAQSLADSSEFSEQGLRYLRELVEKGEVVSVAAAASLAHLAKDKQEAEGALKQISSLEKRQPWQSDLLRKSKDSLSEKINASEITETKTEQDPASLPKSEAQ